MSKFNLTTLSFLIEEDLYAFKEKKESGKNMDALDISQDTKVILLHYDKNNGSITNIEQQFLTKILSALGLSESEVSFINIGKKLSFELNAIIQYPQQYILGFGVPNGFFPDYMQKGILYNWQEKSVLLSPSLTLIEQDKELKQLLWLKLKEMFSIQ